MLWVNLGACVVNVMGEIVHIVNLQCNVGSHCTVQMLHSIANSLLIPADSCCSLIRSSQVKTASACSARPSCVEDISGPRHDLPTKRAMGLVGLSFIWEFYFESGSSFLNGDLVLF